MVLASPGVIQNPRLAPDRFHSLLLHPFLQENVESLLAKIRKDKR